jgi:hypothetical protein
VVITIIEGNATSREIEQSFNMIFGDSWRCTARAIGPNQYTMRFPTPREVERAVCYGASMKLKTVDATVSLSPWTASVGAKAPLQKAWVKISNIPLDKRCETNVFYAGGLVGVSLDLDASTLHKPEYVKVLIGCRDIDMIPSNAEGCLGDNFYDFYYEVDKIVVGKLSGETNTVAVGNSGAPSPKRQRVEQSNMVTEENSESQLVSSQTESVQQSHHRERMIITDVTEEIDTQESEDDSTGGELLIETIAREHADAQRETGTSPNKWLVPCPILDLNKHVICEPVSPMAAPLSSLLLPYSQALSAVTWPPLPMVTDFSDSSSSPLGDPPGYLVQSPDASLEDNVEEAQEESDPRMNCRRASADMNSSIMEKVEIVARKRSLEGNAVPTSNNSNSFSVLSNSELMCRAHKMGVNIPDNDFAAIDILRDLEASRNDLAEKCMSRNNEDTLFIENNVGNSTPLSMDWNPVSDNEEPFTIVRNKGRKASRKKPVVVISRPNTRSQTNEDLLSGDKSAPVPGRVARKRTKPSRFK